MHRKVLTMACAAFMLFGASARAQEAIGTSPSVAAESGPRFRSGISFGGGFEKVSVVSGGMFGLDGRLGIQLSDLLALYVQPHLSFGSLSGTAGPAGGTGTFSIAALGEATFRDRFFLGGGFGYGVLNNPAGAMLQARAGGYVLSSRDDYGGRRKGLMAGVDFRSIFVDGATGVLLLASIGYEKY